MKTRSTRSLRRLQFKIRFFCDYTEEISQLEKAVARKPEKFQIDILGSGELSADTALLLRSVLVGRSPKTHLITNARSSLQGGAVLLWLVGDTRLIREDAKLYFRKSSKEDEDEDHEDWKDEQSDDAEVDLEEANYSQVLQYIDHYLPVKELAGRPVGLAVLRQFGLVDNEKVDRFLASAFADGAVSPEHDKPRPQPEMQKVPPKVASTNQPNRQE
jgi:hypothetical protein